MIPDADIWRAALLMTRCFRRDAADQAAAYADELAVTSTRRRCGRIAAATERLQAQKPAEGEPVH